jgi:phosphoribosylamine--glycine ligase
MMRMKSNFVTLLDAAIDGELDQAEADWDIRVAMGVVLAAHNYPETPRKGDAITGLEHKLQDAHVFHAGTTDQNGAVVTAGGRVLCVTALGDTVRGAQKLAYDAIENIKFDGMQYRKDIGYRAIKR